MGGTPMSFIIDFLRGHEHRNEALFLRTMERLGIVLKGSTEKAFLNCPYDPRSNAEHPKNKDDDEMMYLNF